MKRFLPALAAAIFITALLIAPGRASADAADITKSCKFTASSGAKTLKRAVDGSLSSMWKSDAAPGQSIDITPKDGTQAGGLYLRWDTPPQGWTLTGYDGSGAETAKLTGGTEGYLSEYIALPEEFSPCAKLKLSSDGPKGMAIVELSVYEPGPAPFYAPMWQPSEGRTDVMIVSAHPDDDVLFMGGVIPTYAQQGRSAVTVYMTYGARLRRFEAMEGSWIEGERIQPVMGPFPDTFSKTDPKPVQRAWTEQKTLAFLVEQIRKYRPSVIVTHDEKGEYGHGAHKWTSAMVREAFTQAADPSLFPESAAQYGPWQAGKVYLHLYKQNKLTIETSTPLSLFDGKTAFQIAKLAYTRHVSQHVWAFKVSETGHSIKLFGLADTRLGQDTAHTDMFENVTDEAMLKLNPWYNYAVVDRSALSDAITRAEAMPQADYTADSWAEAKLPAAIEAARAVLDNREAPQADVDAAAVPLSDAMNKLVHIPELTAITVATPPQKLIYRVGEALDLTGLAVTGRYSDGAEKPMAVTAENVTGFNSAAPAAGQQLTVTVEGKTAEFTVKIADLNRDVQEMQSALQKALRWLGFVS